MPYRTAWGGYPGQSVAVHKSAKHFIVKDSGGGVVNVTRDEVQSLAVAILEIELRSR